jgi:hypothetical protein
MHLAYRKSELSHTYARESVLTSVVARPKGSCDVLLPSILRLSVFLHTASQGKMQIQTSKSGCAELVLLQHHCRAEKAMSPS